MKLKSLLSLVKNHVGLLTSSPRAVPEPILLQQGPAMPVAAPPPSFASLVREAYVAEPRTEPVTAEAQRRGRPLSSAMTKTMAAIAKNPAISPAQLAKTLSVSPSYARTLLRRAKSKQPEVELSVPPAPASPELAPVLQYPAPVPAAPPQTGIETVVADLAARLEQAEGTLQRMRSVPPVSRGNWDLNRRAEVIRRSSKGESTDLIASTLGVPSGEVAFIVKVHEMLAAPV